MPETPMSKQSLQPNKTEMWIDAENVSNEGFVHVFHHLDKKSLVNCILACRRFQKLISNDSFWVEHARLNGTTDVLPPLNWRRAVTQKKFDGNDDGQIQVTNLNFDMKRMVFTGHGYSTITPKFESHFENARDQTIRGVLRSDDFLIRGPADGIRMETVEGHPDISKCFAFSYTSGAILVFIDFVSHGIDPWVMDYVRPKIRISQKVSHRNDCSARLSFAVQLNYNETQWIQEIGMRQTNENVDQKRFKSVNKEWEQWSGSEWEDWVLELNGYPSGMRHLTVLNEGKDGLFWAGHYGPKVANIQIQIIMPETPMLKQLAADTEKCREDEAPVAVEEENRFGFGGHRLRLRHGMWAVPPAQFREMEDDEDE
ncbi:hypothetical protein L5515_004482 [Caenorhabditis briggsae]|uniref:FBA domain-containing protein n=1 Tax=Caenorhabditis briggsae TaxID=6238 RepID=A0AAE9EKW8_CAEBR|nr:hypothetical protein L5515_004482 [Caenorhabditis briggsae]